MSAVLRQVSGLYAPQSAGLHIFDNTTTPVQLGERYAYSRTNLLPIPVARPSESGWLSNDSSTWTIQKVTDARFPSGYAAKSTVVGGGLTSYVLSIYGMGHVWGNSAAPYKLGLYTITWHVIAPPTGTWASWVNVRVYNAAGVFVAGPWTSPANIANAPAGKLTQLSYTFTIPPAPGGATMRFSGYIQSMPITPVPIGTEAYIGDACLEYGVAEPRPFFSGFTSRPGATCAWTGTPNGSSSTMTHTTPYEGGLVTNGYGQRGSNYNFPDFTYDSNDKVAGLGSFKVTTAGLSTFRSAEAIKVDTTKGYRLSMQAKANGSLACLLGIAEYDEDDLNIQKQHVAKYSSSSDAVLASPLNPGDTTIHLSDATGWCNAGQPYYRQLAWWPYTSSRGTTYPDYSYTRNLSVVGLWGVGGITGNVITLNAPWAGPALAAGTKVRNASAGDTSNYCAMSGGSLTAGWALRQSGTITGEESNTPANISNLSVFRAGTDHVRILFMPMVAGTFSFADIRFEEV